MTALFSDPTTTGVVAPSSPLPAPEADDEAPAESEAEATLGELESALATRSELEAPAGEGAGRTERVQRQPVHGRYRSGGPRSQLELRVDVGGPRAMNRVSGDFFEISGGTTAYAGSFVVDAPTVSAVPGVMRIEGAGRFTFSAAAPRIRVKIPRRPPPAPRGDATVEFLTATGAVAATYLCRFASPFFRSVRFEQDSVRGAVPFVSYDTGSLPQPPSSPARVLTVAEAFAEAGIELQVAGTANVIDTSGAGADAVWSEAELHASMVSHFSLWADAPHWQVWLLVATAHEEGARGIMFDAAGAFQRQGCAVFYDAIKGEDAANQRAQLRTYVHELGHAFNLLHSWQKNLANPPRPLGPNGGLGDLSWMNYAWKYQPVPPAPGGEAAYWSGFPFQFTDSELLHLRHGFYRDVVMGGKAFGTGAADVDPAMFDEPVLDESGLALELRSKGTFAYGEPVVVELKLSTTDLRGRTTHSYLHPKSDFVSVAIRQPSGRTVTYRPMLVRCLDESLTVRLDADKPAVYQSAYIGYGRDGFYFEQPGRYELVAQYVANDGSRVVSAVHPITVRSPISAPDERVAELLMGDEQGQLFYLLGSDSDALKSGNEALDVLLDEHGDHPLAVYPRLVKGINAERDFKDVRADRSLHVRPARPQESIELLSSVVDASTDEEGVDNITLNTVMRRLAWAEAKAGNPERGAEVMDRMVDVFSNKALNRNVLRGVREQAEKTKAALRAETR